MLLKKRISECSVLHLRPPSRACEEPTPPLTDSCLPWTSLPSAGWPGHLILDRRTRIYIFKLRLDNLVERTCSRYSNSLTVFPATPNWWVRRIPTSWLSHTTGMYRLHVPSRLQGPTVSAELARGTRHVTAGHTL
jgi:hypothetical protein